MKKIFFIRERDLDEVRNAGIILVRDKNTFGLAISDEDFARLREEFPEVYNDCHIMNEVNGKSYRIVGRTNGWMAQRSQLFNGKENIVIETCLTLKEAQQKILDFYNEDYDSEGLAFGNWGLCRIHNPHNTWSHKDGTRGYENDGKYFSIEEENQDE